MNRLFRPLLPRIGPGIWRCTARLVLLVAAALLTGPAWSQAPGSNMGALPGSPLTPAGPASTAPRAALPNEAVLQVHPLRPAEATLALPGRWQHHNLRINQRLLVKVPDVNPFMHEVVIQGTSAVYELVAPTVGGGAPPANAPPVSAAPAPGSSPPSRLDELTDQLGAYNDLLDRLRACYASAAWPGSFVQAQITMLDGLAIRVFDTTTPSARLVAATAHTLQLALAAEQLAQTAARDQQKELLGATGQLLTTSLGAAQRTQAEAAQREYARLVAVAELQLTGLARLEKTQQQAVGAYSDEELLLLGHVYEKLREAQATPEMASKELRVDGDEFDVNVTLKPLASYDAVLAATPAPALTYDLRLNVTGRFRVSVSAGAYVSGLVNHRYSLFEDSTRNGRQPRPGRPDADTTTVPHYKRMKRIERENTEEKIDVGVTTLTHFHFRFSPTVDLAASVGVGVQTSGIRLMGGGTLLFGGREQRLCLTYGLVAGPATRLAGGYVEGPAGKVAASTNTVPTQTINKTSWFLAATWNLTGTRK